MSISDEILRLQTAKSDLATSIANKGVTVPANATLDDYAALVDSIQTGGGGGTLPYDAEVEYLQSNPSGGTSVQRLSGQKISLFTPTINDEVEVKFMILEKTSNAYFGARTDPYRFSCTTFSSGSYTAFAMTNNAWPSQRATVTLDAIYIMSAKNGSYTINGSTYSTTQLTSASFGDFLMFCCRDSSNADIYSKIRCYYVKVYRNGNVLHDFIPVRTGQAGFLYDKISGKAFVNSGAGSFTLGNDV